MDRISKRTFTNKKSEKLRPFNAIYNYYLNSKSNRGYNAAKYFLTSLSLTLVASSQLNNYCLIFTQIQMLVNFVIFK